MNIYSHYGGRSQSNWLNNPDLHAHALEPVNSLLEGLDVKDDYEDIKHKLNVKNDKNLFKNEDEPSLPTEPSKHKRNIEKHLKDKNLIKNKDEPSLTTEPPKHKREKRYISSNVSHDNIDDALAEQSSLDLIKDWDGYYIGDVWSAQRSKNRQRLINRQRNNVNSYAQRPFYQHVDTHG